MRFLRVFHTFKYPLFIVVIIGLAIWLAAVNHMLIEQLKSQGKDYNVGVATITPENGKPGESAYEIAKRHGFKGTESEWLLSLMIDGSQGGDGLSAYQIAVLHGFTGSATEWLASLKGEPGTPGASIKGDPGANGLTPPCLFEESQCRGASGQSIKGDPGAPGRTSEYTCRENTAMWKYTDEDDTAWRPWFTVLSCSQPPAEPIN